MIEESNGAGDQVFESNGVRLFVDPVSVSYLKGAEVDFVDTVTGGGFTIKNPQATSTCGCGSSFSVDGEGGGGHHHYSGPTPALGAWSDTCVHRGSRLQSAEAQGRQTLQQARANRQRVPPPGGTPERRRPGGHHPA